MQRGIDYSSCIVVFITQRYIKSALGKGEKGKRDNCRFEFNHIANTKAATRVIPVVMEPRCRDQARCFGSVQSSTHPSPLYIDFCSDDAGRAEAVAAEIVKMVRRQVPFTVAERLSSLSASTASSSSSIAPSDTKNKENKSFCISQGMWILQKSLCVRLMCQLLLFFMLILA
jgi:hypothetical protein